MLTKTTEGKRLRVTDDISQLVGETPILQLKKLVPAEVAGVYAKLEYLNPGRQRERPRRQRDHSARRSRRATRPGGTIVEATAGNTGIGLALIGVQRGYKVALFVPERFSEEKVAIMRALGAEVTRTPDAEGMQGAIRRANEFVAATPAHSWPASSTIPPIPTITTKPPPGKFSSRWKAIDALVIGAGTAGTFTGVARFMKERLPRVLAYAVETQGSILGGGKPGPHKVEGIGASFIPGNFDRSVCDEVLMVTDADAFAMVKALAAREGVLSGSSGGANVVASRAGGRLAGPGKTRGHHDSRFGRTLFVEENLRRRNLKRQRQLSAQPLRTENLKLKTDRINS